MATLFVSCEKEPISTFKTLNSMAGVKHTGVEVQFYEITPNDKGDCIGIYFSPTKEEFGYLLRVTGGITNLNNFIEEAGDKMYTIDFEFTGRNYYCNKPYFKTDTDGSPGNYPFEIQEVKVLDVYPNF